MSTNATIAILNKDGTINMTYCHHDGYLIGGVGEKLLNHYKDAESVKNLIKGEAMDRLDETKQSTEFYGVGKNPGYLQSSGRSSADILTTTKQDNNIGKRTSTISLTNKQTLGLTINNMTSPIMAS